MIRVKIARDGYGHGLEVDAYEINGVPGLCLVRVGDDGDPTGYWTVTHCGTGRKLPETFESRDEAARVASVAHRRLRRRYPAHVRPEPKRSLWEQPREFYQRVDVAETVVDAWAKVLEEVRHE